LGTEALRHVNFEEEMMVMLLLDIQLRDWFGVSGAEDFVLMKRGEIY